MAGLVDRCVLRDGDGLPYLAGSALKGKFRHAVLRIRLARSEGGCEFGDRPDCAEQAPCLVCDLFGSRVRRGKLLFSDAHPGAEHRLLFGEDGKQERALFRADALYRGTTAIDRVRGIAREGHLFTTEVLPAGLEFEATVRGPAEYKTLLREAAQVLTHFGSGGARGLGRCLYSLGGGAA
jgi:CRISPR/Cas system CSM-associated protein Csm3 (group 7 of RAMP superfamily)